MTSRQETLRRIFSGTILVVFVCVFLMYLNSMFYSFWVAGGPPNPHPLGWERRGLTHLFYAIASLLFGLGLSKAINSYPLIRRSAYILAILSAILLALPHVARSYLVYKCQNQGSTWSNEAIQCSNE
jgi:hypothetical protein